MLKICFSQFEVEPGHPDLNFSKMLQAINEAKQNHADIIIFPEMAIPGYLLGDTWEQTSYLKDCLAYGDDIIAQSDDICIIFGNIAVDWSKKKYGRARAQIQCSVRGLSGKINPAGKIAVSVRDKNAVPELPRI